MLSNLYTELLYRPLFNGLIALYVFLPGRDFGVAIIALTILVRLLLYPLGDRQYRSQRALSELQPKIQDIRAKVKNPQEQTKRLMALYKESGVHPASGCLPVLVQLPVLFAIYRVLVNGLHPEALSVLYGWVPNPQTVETIAFGFLDLGKPNAVLAVAAGVFQYFQTRLMLPPRRPQEKSGERDFTSIMNTQTLYVMPVITVVFALGFPAGLSLYWVTTTILGILQQMLLMRHHGPTSKPPAPVG
jgi:YidC/Oxa1 family membrane protein insertase